MSSDRQRSDDESPSTSSGSSDADQRDPAAPEPEEQEERKPSATQQKKNTKLSSKTTAKLSTSAKRIQKELAEITLDPPPNCRGRPCPLIVTTCATVKICKDIQLQKEEPDLSVSSFQSV
uniref:Ubiquitin conjugating enzyme E2 E3 n=1 Tax=Cebus imitator TaxID=2715852 RepID=A0A2K5RHA1_CEBIM